MPAPTIDAVVFDFGDVLVRWDIYAALLPRYSRQEIDTFIEATDFFTFNYEQDAGRSWDEGLEWFRARYPQWAGYVEAYLDNVRGSVVEEVPGTSQIVRELLAGGVTCCGLTNWSREYYHLAAEVAPVIHDLDELVVSGIERVAKPDPRIYAITTQRLGLDPASILFVDDQPRNVQGARDFGWQAVVFTDADTLRADLWNLGLPVAHSVHESAEVSPR